MIRCKSLIHHGRFGDACHSLASVGVVYSEEIVITLLGKHTQLFPPPLPGCLLPDVITTDEVIVLKVIRSIPRGTTYEQDGLRAQHLLDILSGASSMDHDHVISSLTSHVNFLLRADLL